MKQLITTSHAKERIETRVGVRGKAQIKKHVSKIYKSGYRMYDVEKGLREYINNKVKINYNRAKVIRLKEGYIYLFTYDCVLLTVLNIPNRFKRWD